MGHADDGADLACKALTLVLTLTILLAAWVKCASQAFWDFPKPSVCAVNGLAVGGGANLALSNYHDYVICSDKVDSVLHSYCSERIASSLWRLWLRLCGGLGLG